MHYTSGAYLGSYLEPKGLGCPWECRHKYSDHPQRLRTESSRARCIEEKVNSREPSCWSLPPLGKIKLNVDAAVYNECTKLAVVA